MKCPICGETSLHLTDHECEPMMATEGPQSVDQRRLVRLAGYRVTVNGSPAEIINNTVRWQRAIGYFEFAEDHGGQWSKDGLEWWIDGKTIKFYEPNADVRRDDG